MKAAVWYGQKDVRVEEREPKELQDNEVRLKYLGLAFVVQIYMNT